MKIFLLTLFFALSLPFSSVQAAEGDCYCVFSDETYTQYSGDDVLTEPDDCSSACEDEADSLGKTLDRPEYDDGEGDEFNPGAEGLVPAEDSLSEGIEAEAGRRAEIEARAEAFAEDGLCQCYCGTEGVGTRSIDGRYEQAGKCKEACEANGKTYTTCARSSSETPLANPICWGSDECLEQDGLWSTDQPTECEPSRHYCYPEPEAVSLNVNIGGITEISDIGSYVNAFYTYGLGAAAVIAVVLIMIGGAQYILGSGIGSVEAGKKRIVNAVTGLVILLGAYLILSTVNPYLVNWKTIRVSKIKPSLFVEGSCEDYQQLGYLVDPAETSSSDAGTYCGDAGIVSSNPEGIEMAMDCIYDSCSHTSIADDFCATVGDDYQCLSCQNADADAAETGLKITEGLCRSLSPTPSSLTSKVVEQCRMMREADVTVASTVLESTDVCGLITIDCSAVVNCGMYESVTIAQSTNASLAINVEARYEQLVDVCTEDVCGIGPCLAVNVEGTDFAAPYGNTTRANAMSLVEQGHGYKLSSDLIVGTSFFDSTRYELGIAGDDYIVCLPPTVVE